jgi:FAD:protein FMN transferase
MGRTVAPAVLATGPAEEREPVDRHTCRVFSCDVEFVALGRRSADFASLEELLRTHEQRFSRFVPGNELALLNDGDGGWVQVSAEMRRLLRHALDVSVRSRGLVNVAVSNAVRAAGYVRSWPAPWADDAAAAEQPDPVAPLTELLEVRGDRARLSPGHRLDFGALAKGLWADDVVELLGPNAAASLGGDISARGAGPDGEGWPLGLSSGRTVLVRDGGLSTSGTSKRRSGAAHHIIDPRTGRPSASDVVEASVLAPCAASAEWLATALVVGGAEATSLLAANRATSWTTTVAAGAKEDS